MALANVTVTATTTATTTIVNTATTTVEHQAAPFLLFGLPPELVLGFTAAIVFVVFMFFKLQVKGMPVIVEWIYRNYSARQFRAQEDLGGLWLYILNARGKRAATLKKTGMPIEVAITNNKSRAYIIQEKSKNGGLPAKIHAELEDAHFKIKELPGYQEGRFSKGRKAYLLEEPEPPKKTLAYIDTEAGGQKRFRKYTVVEGTGTTLSLLDVKDKVDETAKGQGEDEASAGMVHEELAAAKSFLVILAEAMQGTLRSMVLPLVAGIGIGVTIIVLVVTFTGGKL